MNPATAQMSAVNVSVRRNIKTRAAKCTRTVPNERIFNALQEIEEGKCNSYKNSDEMFKNLGIKV